MTTYTTQESYVRAVFGFLTERHPDWKIKFTSLLAVVTASLPNGLTASSRSAMSGDRYESLLLTRQKCLHALATSYAAARALPVRFDETPLATKERTPQAKSGFYHDYVHSAARSAMDEAVRDEATRIFCATMFRTNHHSSPFTYDGS